MPHNYIYVIVRTDLPIEQQLVQAAHSALEAGREFSNPTTDSHLILLEAKSQDTLLNISQHIAEHNIKHHLFFEPDDDRGYTSLTTESIHSPELRAVFKKYRMYQFKANRAFSINDETF